ncbi:hypothetical protein NS115_11080 [Paenibacillus jamilae]|uniref:Uncharacterized protein n=1 Tax=Paenibacillus jamilae TaxID=114136 RepID=A0ACC4ZVI7_9BACL|nr:hypothetical protein NS115_11080 [Paenibacillus jamilae]
MWARNPDSVGIPGFIPLQLDITNPDSVAATAEVAKKYKRPEKQPAFKRSFLKLLSFCEQWTDVLGCLTRCCPFRQ